MATHILLNILRIKGNQTIKFGQLMEHPKSNIFLKTLCTKWARETSSRPLFVFLKSFILGKSKWSAAWFHYILIALKLAYNRNKLFKTLHYWSRDMLNFDFLDKGLGIVSPAHFVYDFWTKMFLMLYYILLTTQISLPGFLYFLGYWAICVLQLFVIHVVTSWILKLALSFQPSRFFYMTNGPWQKPKYLENENSF